MEDILETAMLFVTTYPHLRDKKDEMRIACGWVFGPSSWSKMACEQQANFVIFMYKKKERGLGSMQKREHFTLHENYSYGNTGLYKLCHPAILDGRTWSKLGRHGEHGEHGGHGKNGKHQPDNLPLYLKFKILLCDSKRWRWARIKQNVEPYAKS